MRIYLVGFMGVGKSHLGSRLAKLLGFRFVDLDEWIEAGEGMAIDQVFSVKGEAYFRKAEAARLRQTIFFQNTVIATGGGTPCFSGNMPWMNDHGLTIFLNADPASIASRLALDKNKRPLLRGLTDDQLTGFVGKKLEERMIFYNQAHLQLDLDGDENAPIREIAGFLKRFLKTS